MKTLSKTEYILFTLSLAAAMLAGCIATKKLTDEEYALWDEANLTVERQNRMINKQRNLIENMVELPGVTK